MSTDEDIEVFARGRRRRMAVAVAFVAALLAAVAGAWILLTPRRVTIVGPTEGKITVGEEKPAWFPARVGLVVELAPGRHVIQSDDASNHDVVEVPVLTRSVVQPARRDHCLIVASAMGAYAFDGTTPAGTPFDIVERCADSYAASLVVSNLYIDPCMLPYSKDVLSDAYLAVAVPRDEAPTDDASANATLTALLLACG